MTVFVRNLQPRKRSGLKVDRRLLVRMTTGVLELIPAPDDTIGIILVNDKQIAGFNESFHHHTGPTDILTFPYPELAGGELIISVERAVAHARRYRTTPGRELALYVVHGILHLHGHDDRTPRQRARMRVAERRLLARLGRSFDLPKLVASK